MLLLHLLGFNAPPLCKAASLFCYLKAIPAFLWTGFPRWGFCSLGSERQSHLFMRDQALGGCRRRVSFRLYVPEEKHLQLYRCGVAALPPRDTVWGQGGGLAAVQVGPWGAQGRMQGWASGAQQVQQQSMEGRDALFMCWNNLGQINLEKLTGLRQGFWVCNYKDDIRCSGLFSTR